MLAGEKKKQVHNRIRRISGQVEGVARMIESEAYCVDVLLQLGAAQAALRKVAHIVLEDHLHTCVCDAFEAGSEGDCREKIDELLQVFSQYERVNRR